MAQRKGKTIILESRPCIIANAGVAGKKESEGPLGEEFDETFEDTTMGQDCWEKAETELMKKAIEMAITKAAKEKSEIDAIFAGDLLNQCIGSTFAIREMNIPSVGLYGACSTMALSLSMAALSIESGGFSSVIAATSSHFCSAEKQFRYPLEYGGQRTPTAQWTVTGAGAAVLSKDRSDISPYIDKVHIGTIQDYGILDAANMGAAMAPVDVKIEP